MDQAGVEADGEQSPRVIVKVRDASKRDFVLTEQTIALPVEARGLCTFFDFSVPQGAVAGIGSIFVNDTKISTIQITR